MKYHFISYFIIFTLIICTPVIAKDDEINNEKGKFELLEAEAELKESIDFTKILIAEGYFIIFAESCSNAPNVCGGGTALITTWLVTHATVNDEYMSPAAWAAAAGFGALSIYNISVDEDAETKNDSFKKNMLALNIIGAFTYYFLNDRSADKYVSLQPMRDGGIAIGFNYKF